MRNYNDETIRDLLPEFVRDALSDEMRATIEAQLALSPDLRAEADLLRAYRASTEEMQASSADVARIALSIPPYDPISPLQRKPRLSRWLAGAASMRLAAIFVVAAFGITAITMLHRQSPVSTTTSIVANETAPVTVPAGITKPGVTLVGTNALSDEDLIQLINALEDVHAEPPNEIEGVMAVAWGGVI